MFFVAVYLGGWERVFFICCRALIPHLIFWSELGVIEKAHQFKEGHVFWRQVLVMPSQPWLTLAKHLPNPEIVYLSKCTLSKGNYPDLSDYQGPPHKSGLQSHWNSGPGFFHEWYSRIMNSLHSHFIKKFSLTFRIGSLLRERLYKMFGPSNIVNHNQYFFQVKFHRLVPLQIVEVHKG